jgi:hypothetical protein
MAKQIGVVQISGALGEVVGAKKSAGQKHNIIRVRAYEPKNPRTDDQMIQRLKAKAATNIYAALKGILNHSFEGVKYGAPSRNYFLQQAMLMAEGTFPWLVKGDSNPIPGSYLISKGSIAPLALSFSDDTPAINIGLPVDAELSEITSLPLGAFGGMLQRNGIASVGDQLTFVTITRVSVNSRYSFQPTIVRMVMDNDTETLVGDWAYNNGITLGLTQDKKLTFKATKFGAGTLCFGAAIIISRPVVDENNNTVDWQRSTQYIVMNDDEEVQAIFANTAKAAAIASFKKATADPKSAWYLNQGKLSK